MTAKHWDMVVIAALAIIAGLIISGLMSAWDREACYERKHRVIPPAVLDTYGDQQ
ncbi:MAG: hypothetical protein ACYC2H_01485 [Thermoplasmatota archaeon]